LFRASLYSFGECVFVLTFNSYRPYTYKWPQVQRRLFIQASGSSFVRKCFIFERVYCNVVFFSVSFVFTSLRANGTAKEAVLHWIIIYRTNGAV